MLFSNIRLIKAFEITKFSTLLELAKKLLLSKRLINKKVIAEHITIPGINLTNLFFINSVKLVHLVSVSEITKPEIIKNNSTLR